VQVSVPIKSFLAASPEVADALGSGGPVVALESTIITHGMPYPQNLEMAGEVEAIVRAAGAVPATVALLGGKIRVGLAAADLQQLAETGMSAAKASRRDVAALLTAGATAGTTVATTMQAADMAGISVFATGGIGGVHRGAELSFDISADLEELSRTPVAVVCAGAKAILDLPKTLEVLETRGVPVVGYGTDDFPAFWTRSSGLKADHRLDTPEAVAELLDVQLSLGMGGVLVANPIPAADAMDAGYISSMIERALADAEQAGISGKATTPYLLQRIFELTGGKSLVSNIALVKNNARVAAEIAVALAARRRDE
jgi:pseudouridine-5'-phosphate glycosidase